MTVFKEQQSGMTVFKEQQSGMTVFKEQQSGMTAFEGAIWNDSVLRSGNPE
jgi:hypothetical protein